MAESATREGGHRLVGEFPNGVLVRDPGGRVVACSAGASEILGVAEAELIGSGADAPPWEAIAHDGRPLGAAELPTMRTLATGEALEDELLGVRRADGSMRWLLVSCTPVRRPEPGGAMALFSDVTASRDGDRDLAEVAREQAALRRVATAVARQGDPNAVFALVAREVAQLLGADAGMLVRLAGDRGEVIQSWLRDPRDRCRRALILPLARMAAVAEAVRTGRPALWSGSEAIDGMVCRSRAAAPIVVDGGVWGCLVAARDEDVLPPGAPARLERFAELIALAVAAAEGRERSIDEAASIIFGGELDAGATLDAIARAARDTLGADRATVYVHRRGEHPVGAVHTTETDPRRRRVLERAVDRRADELPVLRRLLDAPGPLLVIEDVPGEPALEPGLATALGSGAFIGLRLEHAAVREGGARTLLGAVFVSFDAPRALTLSDRRRLTSLGALAALALADARLHESTLRSLAMAEERASTDPLTGLATHRTLQQRLQAEFATAVAEDTPMSVVLLDLDRFRQVNDRYGHQAGDHVLAEVARRMSAVTRPGDTLARIGGEEFAWLMPGADDVTAWEAAEAAREAISGSPFEGVGRMSISAGLCDRSHAREADELYRLADGALYWAKAHGRDLTVRYSPEVVTVLSAEEKAERLHRSQALLSIRLLARVVDAKDPSTRLHSERVADLAVQLATAMGWPVARAAALREAALVHDVGKIGIPDRILFKTGALTPDEYEAIKAHAALSAEIVSEVLTAEQVRWVRGHHERFDGGGYPDGLAGEEIPDGARVLATADAWDVMTSVRTYKEAMTPEDALAECERGSGGQFFPDHVAGLRRLYEVGAIGRSAGG